MRKGYSVPGVVTGKPLELGGSLGRYEATGRGVFISTLEAAKHLGLPLNGARVVIQGSGNVGGIAAKYFREAGALVVGISDSRGGLYNRRGLDLDRVFDCKNRYRCLIGKETEADEVSNKELLELECEVLVPAALESQITGVNASNVRCRMIVEGANGPTTPDGDAILFDRGIFVVPDILANAGGVTVSYFEWVQNLQEALCGPRRDI